MGSPVLHQHNMVTVPKVKRHTVLPRIARSTQSTRLLSTRLERLPCMLRESAVTTGSSKAMVVRPSPCSTRRPRQQRRLCFVLCVECKYKSHAALKRAKHFELIDKKK